MKRLRTIGCALFLGSFLASPLAVFGAGHEHQGDQKAKKAKPYTLKTCLVSDEKLGEMGKPFQMTYKDREIKFCCKGCVKDFKKDPAKFIKKLEKAEKDAKKPAERPNPAHDHNGHTH